MKQLYDARDYFKSFFLPNSSSLHGDSMGFVSESYFGATGHEDKGSFADVLLSVSIYRNAYLRLVCNADMGCSDDVCAIMKLDIARKFGISTDRIITHSGKMRQAIPGFLNQQPPPVILEPGLAIGHQSLPGYGTLGNYTINYQLQQAEYIISNNHVLANTNNAHAGDGIYTRGDAAPRQIATLTHAVWIKFGGEPNRLDLATAKINGGERVRDYGPGQIRSPRIGDRVMKIGATTGRTEGVIEALDETVVVDYGGRRAVFEDQIVISGTNGSFSKPGDSGSFIFDSADNIVGLLFAGNGNETNANHADAVIQQLREWQIHA